MRRKRHRIRWIKLSPSGDNSGDKSQADFDREPLVPLNVRIRESVKLQASQKASGQGASLAELVELALIRYLEGS